MHFRSLEWPRLGGLVPGGLETVIEYPARSFFAPTSLYHQSPVLGRQIRPTVMCEQ